MRRAVVSRLGLIGGALAAIAPAGASPAGAAPPPASVPAGSAGLVYRDVTERSGLDFRHETGATGDKQYWEAIGAGACVLDYDGDERMDLFLVSTAGENRLFRNLGGLRFEDVTPKAGVGDPGSGAAGTADFEYGMGAVAADFDNDGDPDLYVTNFGSNRLFVNQGDGTFRESASRRGVDDASWGAGAAFFDGDGDGWLDLYVANYVEAARPDTNICYSEHEKLRFICQPLDYPPARDVYYRNRGDGTFEIATDGAGFGGIAGRGLGVSTLDFDRDGHLDLYVANDLNPNFLFRGRGDGTFEEIGVLAGTSHSEDGRDESGMGVAAGDYDNDGWVDLFVTNFVRQTNSLYHNEGNGFFLDESARSFLGPQSLPYIGWATAFLDFDLDGRRDVFVVNGHVDPDAPRVDPTTTWAQPDFLYWNRGDGAFVEVTAEKAPTFLEPHPSRGAVVADLDDDGDPDLVVLDQDRPARLLVNVSESGNHWIGFRLVGSRSNRDGIGSRVEVHAGDLVSVREVRAGAGYISGHDPRLLFGLGNRTEVDSVVVRWPSGRRDVHRRPAPGSYHRLVEGQ